MHAEAGQYSYNIPKHWLILRLDILINDILIRNSVFFLSYHIHYLVSGEKQSTTICKIISNQTSN